MPGTVKSTKSVRRLALAGVAAGVLALVGCGNGDDSSSAVEAGPIEPTPAQGEGPYYPVKKPVDRDADLTVVEGAPGPAGGDVLLLEGRLLDESGSPVEGAVVEIWQTDGSGIYLHPDDPGVRDRDPNFQSYGESVTDAEGNWDFRTIDPVHYESRPRHVHVKVLVGRADVLTTQIYFDGDPRLDSDPLFAQLGDESRLLVAVVEQGEGDDGESVLIARHDLVLGG